MCYLIDLNFKSGLTLIDQDGRTWFLERTMRLVASTRRYGSLFHGETTRQLRHVGAVLGAVGRDLKSVATQFEATHCGPVWNP